MELLNQVTITEILFPAIAVAGVLIGAVLVFVFGFKSAEEPQFDKLPLVVDDRKSSNKKRKTKEKKSTPNGQVSHEPEVKSKKVSSETSKKSPSKDKSKEKSEKVEKPKPKEKAVEVKLVEKKTPKKETDKVKKPKQTNAKPADFDDGEWEKVPAKNEKKTKKTQDEARKDSPTKDKKESPTKDKKDSPAKDRKKLKDSKKEESAPETVAAKKEEKPIQKIDKELQDKINELQNALNEMEKRERSSTPVKAPVAPPSPATPSSSAPVSPEVVKDKKKSKIAEEPNPIVPKPGKKEKAKLEAPEPAAADNEAVFDELGDSWNDAKAPKKGKKKVRKDQ